MKPRTPLCDFALRFDQVYPGIEVVVFNPENELVGRATELERKLSQVETFGKILRAPYASASWYGGLEVDLTGYVTHYWYRTYDTRDIGLNPRVELRGWCSHLTDDHLEAGIYSANGVHGGSRCPDFFTEVTWGKRFMVKFKDAYRVLGCQPFEARTLLMANAIKQYEDEEDYRAYVEWSSQNEDH